MDRRPRRRARALAALFVVGLAGLAVYSRSNPSAERELNKAPLLPPIRGEQPPIETVPPKLGGAGGQQVKASTPSSLPLSPSLSVSAASAILIDAVSGQVLYEKNPDKPRPMASTTKIMTGLLFCENVPDDAIICASKKASETRESSLHLKCNEKVSAHDLLRAIMLRSANDGCVAAAEHIAGTEAKFADLMNRRAVEIGATQTHFVNPHGLHDKNHYTTARDLALIARVAMQNPRFEEVVRTRHYVISRSSGSKDISLKNHSRFLGKFPGADGIKTGWTIPAGKCYVGSATYGGWRLITVVLKSQDYIADTQALMKFGYDRFKPYVVARPGDPAGECAVQAGERTEVPAVVKRRVQVVAAKTAPPQIESRIVLPTVTAPVQIGQTVGTFEAVVDGRVVCASPVIANDAAPAVKSLAGTVSQSGRGRFWLFTGLLIGCAIVLRFAKRSRWNAMVRNFRRKNRLPSRL